MTEHKLREQVVLRRVYLFSRLLMLAAAVGSLGFGLVWADVNNMHGSRSWDRQTGPVITRWLIERKRISRIIVTLPTGGVPKLLRGSGSGIYNEAWPTKTTDWFFSSGLRSEISGIFRRPHL